MTAVPQPIGSPFIELQQVDSTNNYATALMHAGMAPHGTVVFAYEQTKGRGQRNKTWFSQKNHNIAMSAVLHTTGVPVTNSFRLNMAMAVAACTFFARYAGEETKIKWPNDIFWRDRKAAGILIENSIQGNGWKYAVVGIGMNINQTHFGLLENKAVSLKQITGKNFSIIEEAKNLCRYLEEAYQAWLYAPGQVEEKYGSLLYKKEEVVKLRKGTRVFETTIKRVTPDGQLVTQNALEETFEAGEVEWVL